jgi:hypothetical protein
MQLERESAREGERERVRASEKERERARMFSVFLLRKHFTHPPIPRELERSLLTIDK